MSIARRMMFSSSLTSPALIAQVSAANNSSGATTGSIDTTGATLLVVHLAFYTSSTPTVSDSKSNTWTARTKRDNEVCSRFYYCSGGTVGSGHTFTVSGANSYASIAVAAFSLATAYDVENGVSTGTAGAGTQTVNSGSVTPSNGNCLILTGFAKYFTVTGTPTLDNGMTVLEHVDFSNGNYFGNSLGYKLALATDAVNPGWTFTFGSGATPKLALSSAVFR